MPETCSDLIAQGKLQPDFFGMIAHGTHSINVEALQQYFEPKASSSNNIPVINTDLLSHKAILDHAPELGVKDAFKLFALKQVDWVMSHMGEEHFDMGTGYGVVERIIHQLHMIEIWIQANSVYQGLHKAPPSPSLCSCLTDTDNNRVMDVLKLIALQVREPELMVGRQSTVNDGAARWTGNIYRFTFNAGNDLDVLAQSEEGFPKLDSAENWKVWKHEMESMKGHGSLVLAQYLYCKLHP
jgi:hypothetical protein